MIEYHVATKSELANAFNIRYQVFTLEQGIDTNLDFDGKDSEAIHLIALNDEGVVGTMRMLINNDKSLFQRLAVLKKARSQGVGTGLMTYAIDVARSKGVKLIEGHSQEYIKKLYTKIGFELEGEPFMEVGIPHVTIKMKLYRT